jgi:hypothetical protein
MLANLGDYTSVLKVCCKLLSISYQFDAIILNSTSFTYDRKISECIIRIYLL